MGLTRRLTRFLFICLTTVCFAWLSSQATVKTDIHIISSHHVVVDHHHHNLFESHSNHDGSSSPHIHLADSLQTNALVSDKQQWAYALATVSPPGHKAQLPPDVFLEGLLRPPQADL